MDIIFCTACGKEISKRPQGRQLYCSAIACQRERRKRWQHQKRKTDPDYKENQSRAQKEWSRRNPSYWTEYRQSHAEYRERNKKMQRERNDRRKKASVVKMDASSPKFHVLSGTYHLVPLANGIAKMGLWTVEIRVISGPDISQADLEDDCKERT